MKKVWYYLILIERFKAHAKSKYICNSHKPTHRPEIANADKIVL